MILDVVFNENNEELLADFGVVTVVSTASGGGIDTSKATATAADILVGKTAFAKGAMVTGTMADNGTVNKTLDTSTTSYTIQAGKHSGSGKVSISTETKTVTPTKSQQTVNPSTGKVLSRVTVNAIPSNYIEPSGTLNVTNNGTHNVTQYASVNVNVPTGGGGTNTSDATAAASDILSGKTAYVNGAKVTGTMADNGTVNKVLDTNTTSYTIPAGKHSGSGRISISTETKSVTPTKSRQTVTPSSGKVISSVTVDAIPTNYVDTSDATAVSSDLASGKTAYVNGTKVTGSHVCSSGTNTSDATATAADILSGKTAYISTGKATGSMANRGAMNATFDGINTTSASGNAGYYSGVSVTFDSTVIEALLDAL